ncbi:hypothetical protein [Helicobacter sp.]|nr:hypothetical protein [Helicobacter sp.]MBD5165937.1 hypothetical protein [Helicobacter sp.]
MGLRGEIPNYRLLRHLFYSFLAMTQWSICVFLSCHCEGLPEAIHNLANL